MLGLALRWYTVKKMLAILPSLAGMSPTKLSLTEKSLTFFNSKGFFSAGWKASLLTGKRLLAGFA